MITKILTFYRKVFKKNNAIRRGVQIDGTELGKHINISRYSFVKGSIIGNYTSIGRNSTIINAKIGKFCSISWNVTIGATQHDYTRLTTHAFPYLAHYGFTDTTIRFKTITSLGNDVWIGANAIIMPGVKVGNGAVIGAGSLVTKDVEPFQIVYGIPAKNKGFRFDAETIAKIENMRWWEWSDERIKDEIELFKTPFQKPKTI